MAPLKIKSILLCDVLETSNFTLECGGTKGDTELGPDIHGPSDWNDVDGDRSQ